MCLTEDLKGVAHTGGQNTGIADGQPALEDRFEIGRFGKEHDHQRDQSHHKELHAAETDAVQLVADLVNDQKLIAFFVGEMYLPTGSELAGKTQVEFDLSSLAKMVPMIASADKEETVFTLEVIDSMGGTYTKDIKFITSNSGASAE